jgi:hypothetical protein
MSGDDVARKIKAGSEIRSESLGRQFLSSGQFSAIIASTSNDISVKCGGDITKFL